MTARAAGNYIVIATFAKLYEVESLLVSAQAQKFPAARRGLAEVRTSNDGSYQRESLIQSVQSVISLEEIITIKLG